jgi:hypothetical protein
MHIKAVMRHLFPNTLEEDTSNSLQNLGFNVMNMRQVTATPKLLNGQIHVELLPLFFVTLERNKDHNRYSS